MSLSRMVNGDQNLQYLLSVAGSGLMEEGVISVNSDDSSKFDISGGEGTVVDNTDPLNPRVVPS